MPESHTQFAIDEPIAPGLRYTEEVGHTVRSLPVRYCYLWRDDEADPVSDLEVLSFRQRFGAVAVPAEGIGGVETLPKFRRQGYMRKLLDKALAGMAQRVNVAFLSEGIEGLYEKFSFVPCVADAHLTLEVRHVERALGDLSAPTVQAGIRVYVPDDLPHLVRLYNVEHAHRPWTHVRHAGWDRLIPQQMWNPGSHVLVYESEEQVRGYAVLQGMPFGRVNASLVVDELTAQDAAAARHLLAAVAARCWQLRLSEFRVYEPFDSLVGRVARQLGCHYRQSYAASGDMMGVILNRTGLLHQLEPELRRRWPGDARSDVYESAFTALQRGELVPDDGALLRLLLGYWSVVDAQVAGTHMPAHHIPICAAWFPGGGTLVLPAPYAHKLDRY